MVFHHDVMPKNWDHVDEFASSPLKFSLLLTTFFICFQSSWLTNHIVMIALYYYLGKTGSFDSLCPVQTYFMQLVGACLLIPAIKNFLFTQADIVVHTPCEDKQIKMLILCISALGQQHVK